ncbi:hypothetical protein D9C73_025599 [Collichthys lucidus]|uniref:Uncharacterized protein n=1 Tax=Collichthys lucidus TaxID=240159 RepID=A0A4U5VUD0_COLLU|nr:hypothetical protein D9C73_025599 [Collichthys lucidus]
MKKIADCSNVNDCQCSGSASCCDMCSLTFITQSLGAMGEKVANMAEQITLLEAKLQNTEKDALELRSLIGGSDNHDSGSSAVVIPLEVGDNVYIELYANTKVYDDGMNYNTCSVVTCSSALHYVIQTS